MRIKKTDLESKYENFTAMFDKEKDLMVTAALKKQFNSNPQSLSLIHI